MKQDNVEAGCGLGFIGCWFCGAIGTIALVLWVVSALVNWLNRH